MGSSSICMIGGSCSWCELTMVNTTVLVCKTPHFAVTQTLLYHVLCCVCSTFGSSTPVIDRSYWCCRASRDKVNRTLEDIGLILQYQDHMLDKDDSDSMQDPNDGPPDWESGWADNLLLSRRNSIGSDLLESDNSNSTHCGVLSAAASAVGAASHCGASFVSDDDVPSISGTSNSIQGMLRSDAAQGRLREQTDYPPFMHPTYISYIQQASTKLAAICSLLALPTLAQEVPISICLYDLALLT